MIIGTLGGMIMPMVDEATVMPLEKLRGVPLFDHFRDEHRAHRGRVRDRGAGDAAEDHAGQDVDRPEAAPEPAHEEHAEVDQARGHAAGIHEQAHEDEQGQGDHGVGVHAREQPLGQDREQLRVDEEEIEEAGDAERIGDGHAQEQAHGEAAEKNQHEVLLPSGSSQAMMRIM